MSPAATDLKDRAVGMFVAFLLSLSVLPAVADVWGYVDAKGMAHLANNKLDERYEIFFKGGESFSTEKSENSDKSFLAPLGKSTNDHAMPPSSARASTKLLAFFDVSPAYKAVEHLLKDAAQTHGMDYELLQALIVTESGFDTYAVSPKGAVGLMQLMPSTAQRYGVRAKKNSPVEKKLTDPRININAGSSYLRDLMAMFPGRLELALAAYNAGEGAVQRAGNKVPNYPETKNYVKNVMQLYADLKPPAALVDARATPVRIRMEIMGGAAGRNNMPPLADRFVTYTGY